MAGLKALAATRTTYLAVYKLNSWVKRVLWYVWIEENKLQNVAKELKMLPSQTGWSNCWKTLQLLRRASVLCLPSWLPKNYLKIANNKAILSDPMTLWPTSCHKFAGYLRSLKQVIRVLPLLAPHLLLALGGLQGLEVCTTPGIWIYYASKNEKNVKSSFFKQILNPFEEIPTSTIGGSEFWAWKQVDSLSFATGWQENFHFNRCLKRSHSET